MIILIGMPDNKAESMNNTLEANLCCTQKRYLLSLSLYRITTACQVAFIVLLTTKYSSNSFPNLEFLLFQRIHVCGWKIIKMRQCYILEVFSCIVWRNFSFWWPEHAVWNCQRFAKKRSYPCDGPWTENRITYCRFNACFLSKHSTSLWWCR